MGKGSVFLSEIISGFATNPDFSPPGGGFGFILSVLLLFISREVTLWLHIL